MRFDYPPISGVEARLVLVTHEHADQNGVEVIGRNPEILRSTASRLDTPIGQVTAIASEHDGRAGTERGPNTIFVIELDGLRVCHFGDFGRSALREEQAAAIGRVDRLFVPVGGGPSNVCLRAGPSRCTTAPSTSASWTAPTRSWSGRAT